MTLASTPFYWVECDGPGCEERSPAEDEWSDAASAWDNAEASGWKRATDGNHYCFDHAAYVCERCGKFDDTDDYPGERDYLCVEHAAQEDKEVAE